MPLDRIPTAITWTEEADDEGGAYWLGRHPLGDCRVWDAGVTRPAFQTDGVNHHGYVPPTFASLRDAQKACWEALHSGLRAGRI